MGNFSMGNSFNPHTVKGGLNEQNSKEIVWYDENNNDDILLETKQSSKINDEQPSKRKVLIMENRKYNQIMKKLKR